MDGVAGNVRLISALRLFQPDIRIIVLTALDATLDKIGGLDASADDYLTNPTDADELIARIRAALRRPDGAVLPPTACGRLFYDPATREFRVLDTSLDLNAPPLFGNRLVLSAGPRFAYYDHNYAQAFFGITPIQSAQSGYAPLRPNDGVEGGIGLAAVCLITDRVTWTAFGDYGRLSGGIANSLFIRGPCESRD